MSATHTSGYIKKSVSPEGTKQLKSSYLESFIMSLRHNMCKVQDLATV